ncbi:MAG TPA: hypothetical protein VH917_06515 [Ignavibacteriaceae bacterium]|jgi:hypothetical protein
MKINLTNSLLVIFTAFIITSSNEIFAQIEVLGFGGYQVSSDVSVTRGDLNVWSNPNYGAALSFEVDRGLQAELLWIGQDTYAEVVEYSGLAVPLFDLNIHYFQLGAVYEFRQSRRQRAFPFLAFSAGATLFHPQDTSFDDELRFSITFGGGAKIYLSDNVGLRLQARFLMPMSFSGGGMWCGTGGCSVGVSSYTQFVQGDFTAGIFFRLGN